MIRAISVREFYIATYRPMRLAGRPASTNEQYRVCLNQLYRFCGHDPTLAELSAELVAGVMFQMTEQGRSVATANKFRAHAMALWKFARRRKLVDEFEEVDRLREPRRLPIAWTTEQMGQILRAAYESPGIVCGRPAGLWWFAIIHTVLDTGSRIGAIMQLRREDCDLDDGTVLLRAETQKQLADQLLPLRPSCVRVLRMLDSPREMLFTWPFDHCGASFPTLNRHLRKLLKRAGLPHGRKDLWHKFRRTCASYIKAAGGDPTAQLGHSSAQVTAAYLDPHITQTRRQVDLLPPVDVELPTIGQQQLTLF
jgi:integrase